jgi:signal transduction histidine kinase
LVKAIVEAHEGRVEVKSAPHEGAEFRVVLLGR